MAKEYPAQLYEDLVANVKTLEELGQEHGLTRERIRQIAKSRLNLTGVERQRMRTVGNKLPLQKGRFPEHVAAVWHKAASLGLEVRAWCSKSSLLMISALFINTRRCWISHCTAASSVCKDGGGVLYGRGQITQIGTRIVVFDNPASGQREFYIFPREWVELFLGQAKTRCLYIPATASSRPNMPNAIDLSQYKEAWHLLESR